MKVKLDCLITTSVLTIMLLGCGGDSNTPQTNGEAQEANNTSSVVIAKIPAIPKGEVISEIEESGVKVTFTLSRGEDGDRWLQASFIPLEEGYHVYSKDLPVEGIDGIGRPTLLELSKHEAVSNLGKLTADKKVHNLTSPLNADGFPVYPDGPVTLTLPFSLKAESNATVEIEAKITYMACTKTSCNPPVEGKTVKLSLK